MKKTAIICDLDGTLCDTSHRLHFITDPKKKKDWDAFYAGMVDDPINIWCDTIVHLASQNGIAILYVTGRPDTYCGVTLNWLRQHDCPINGLYMRKEKDNREDSVVKKEIYETQLKDNYDVLFCLEDRSQVVKMWRSLGLVCLQCQEGNF